jgi:crotonobetainyl-CoA:carnitine CoA-transferase CaiB-like acyl-CoA transferase
MAGRLTYPGAPFKMSETPPVIRRAPLLGEQNEEVYTGILGLSKENMMDLKDHGIT